MLRARGHAVLLWYVCGSQDGASPRETLMWLNCQETEEIGTAINAACMNMIKLKKPTEETKLNQADRQIGWSNAYATEPGQNQ